MTDHMTNADIEALCDKLADVIVVLNIHDYANCAAYVAKALTAIRQLQQPWRGIESMGLWDVGFVTDGESVAKAQKAQTDYGEIYFAVEPDDGLYWEPTHWMPDNLPLPAPPEQEG